MDCCRSGCCFYFSVLVLLLTVSCALARAKGPPNVVFILADDLGWDDVSFHGSEIKTPNIDKLAQDGVILNNYYVQPICSPTRGALLSGKYPIHTGLQHEVIKGSQPYGLPLTEVTIAQHLKTLGYSTHVVGKWHVGFCSKGYLPTNRGFDSHLGYYLGHGDFFDHYANDGGYMGYDFHLNGEPLWNETEIYSTDIFTERADSIIRSHNKSQPLFLYLAYQAVHVGNSDDRIQAPQKYVDRFPYIKDINRRMFAGVVSALDDGVGMIYRAVQESGMLDNTVIIFSTDNGGPANGKGGSAACNWPLRGSKFTLWQGGVRGVGFVSSPLLQKHSYVNNQLIHVTDWLPTIYRIAGGNSSSLRDIDGLDQWEVISQNASAVRKEVLLNIDPVEKYESIIVGDFKFICGDILHGRYDGWYPPPPIHTSDTLQNWNGDVLSHSGSGIQSLESPIHSEISEFHQKDTTDHVRFVTGHSAHEHESGLAKDKIFKNLFFVSERTQSGSDQNWSGSLLIDCGQKPHNASQDCHPEKSPCLFNIQEDPCEYKNLAPSMPTVVKMLQERIDVYKTTMVAPGNKPEDPKGNPQLHGGVWKPWL